MIYSISFYVCYGFIQFLFKISKRDWFRCENWQAAHFKCFCGSWLLQIRNQRAALGNYLSPCKWTSAIATLPPTRFGENPGMQSQRASDFCELQSYASIALKSLPCEWLLRFDFFGGVSGDIAPTKSHVILALWKWLRDLRKKKNKMWILEAKSRPCKGSFTSKGVTTFGAHLCVIAPKQLSCFWRNVAAMASRWQHCVRFCRPEI